MANMQMENMSEPGFSLEELSHAITDNARIVSEYLTSQNLPQPSFRSDGPSTVVPKGFPQRIHEAREKLIAKSLEILQLAIGPSEFLPHLATGVIIRPPSTVQEHYQTDAISVHLRP